MEEERKRESLMLKVSVVSEGHCGLGMKGSREGQRKITGLREGNGFRERAERVGGKETNVLSAPESTGDPGAVHWAGK